VDTTPTTPSGNEQKTFPITRLVPNMLTLAGLCCGLTAVRFAMLGKWELSVAMILIAAVIDGFDGAVARMLKVTSEFGAQLDSLADIVNFGIAPALVMHLWSLHQIKGIGWSVALFYVVCCALRLARFNVATNDTSEESSPQKEIRKLYFTGVPSPSGALLCIWPLILGLEGFPFFQEHVGLCILYTAGVGALMVSRVPTFSLKKIRIKAELALPVMLVVGAGLTFLIVEPWEFLALYCIGYMITICISYNLAKRNLPPSTLFSFYKNKAK
jgi:CDP-diacylglycerol---serine O-phosphatidyltransferase